MTKNSRYRTKIPVPVLVDDFSPRSECMDHLTGASVDLARRSVESLGFIPEEENMHVPNIEVIEELESIRSIIESKSKDLHSRERSLSKSISQWNSDINNAQRLIEELSDNLLHVSEQRLIEVFETRMTQLSQLMDQLNKRIQRYEGLRTKWAHTRGRPADTPPVSEKVGMEGDLDSVLGYIATKPGDMNRMSAAASLTLVSASVLSEPGSRFVVNSLFNGVIEIIKSKFNTMFLQSLESDLLSADKATLSRFAAARHTALRKRLGLLDENENNSPVIVSIQESWIGSDKVLDVSSELTDDSRLLHSWNEALSRNASSCLGGKGFMRCFADELVQSVVVTHLELKNRHKGILKSRLLVALLSSYDESTWCDILRGIRKEIECRSNTITSGIDRIIPVLIFMAYRCVEDGLSSRLCLELAATLFAFVESKATSNLVSRFFGGWTQGMWYVMTAVVMYKQETGTLTLVNAFMNILESAQDVSTLSAWSGCTLERIENGLLHPSVASRVKSFLKRIN